MPRCVVVSTGISWGRPGTRTCGISVGYTGGLRRLAQSAVQGLGFRGLTYPADLRILLGPSAEPAEVRVYPGATEMLSLEDEGAGAGWVSSPPR
jgi:hypothetical protein